MEVKRYGNVSEEFWRNSLELFETLEEFYDLSGKSFAICERFIDVALACAEMKARKAISVIEREKIRIEESIPIFRGELKQSYFGEVYGLIYTCEEIAKEEYELGKTWKDLQHLSLGAAERNLPKK